ncbi:MAG: dolichyl-phosphate-mannose-protein mannosyltransferase family protein [Candidatus Gottesmanbacteria bacterium GW2011_GWA2_43_14]|uniref:Dolichyl-phosphate-mannose-protein mannosyltransferase family protein n=1 Tax=Candidatus Gottesmanbacteria bacterium GW2011_GWA2_43_14 TaxID=1618443 RepID=A0A0G1GHW8_9BACT|nr:MAG: dolichyl-phosphate-mannose-protein mannosyltransferase family protein [Candidatus Gottesmanbacteria bacterium GW2011_GWA2_43_14]
MSIKIYIRHIPVLINKHKVFFLIFCLTSVLFIGFLYRDPLSDWDECIYAEYAKEMKLTGNFWTYTWNGNPILEKPPLYGWLMQIPYLWGINEFTSRISSVIFSLGILTLIYFFASKYMSRKIALMAVLIYLASPTNLNYAVKVNTDIGFTFWLNLYAFLIIFSGRRLLTLSVAAFSLTLATLHKGLSSLFFLSVMPVIDIYQRKKQVSSNFLLLFVIVFSLIIPWHIYQFLIWKNGFSNTYLTEHLFIRFFNNIFLHKNLFYYPVVLARDFFPWWMILVIFCYQYFRKEIKLSQFYEKYFPNVFLMTAIPGLFFMAARTQVKWYLMPLYPLISILLAVILNRYFLKMNLKLQTVIKILLISNVIYSFLLIIQPFRFKKNVSPSTESFRYINNLPQKSFNYLVESNYRQIYNKPPVRTIPAQFIYGEKPCSVFYSGKKVNLFYHPDEFAAALETKSGLYLFSKSDKSLLGKITLKYIFQNEDYGLILR